MIIPENSHYGDHQPGKTTPTVVIYKEPMSLMIQLPKNSPTKPLLWDHVLLSYQEPTEP